MTTRDVVVVGAGHNGLTAACYLARAGLDVEVIERDTVAGGAVSTVERWPGVRTDRGSSIHVMVRHSGIIEDLALAEAGLIYDDIDPWGVLPHPDGAIRFSQDLDETCTSIRRTCGARDADAYRDYVQQWTPRMHAFLTAAHHPPTLRHLGRSMGPLYARTSPKRWSRLGHSFVESAETALAGIFTDDRLRAALGWWAAQSGPPPHEAGTAPMAGAVALLHARAAGRPRGGSGMLSTALAARLRQLGGTLRLGDGATRIERQSGQAVVRTQTGDAIQARAVVAACHAVTTARLLGDDAAAARMPIGPGTGMALRLLTDQLPTYPGAPDGTVAAMQLLVRSSNQLRSAYGDLLRGEPASDPPMIVMTPTATDGTIAPPGRHVVTVWAQWHPRQLASGSWETRREAVADGIIACLEQWAPGFTGHILDRFVQTPADLESELGLLGGDLMHLTPSLSAMFGFRPLPGWSAYRAPHPGVYLCGASTHPGGGVWGASGRSAAAVVIRDLHRRRRFHRSG